MTHQQPTTNRAFQEMRKPALDRLADRVPEELSARTGIPFDRQRQVFSLSSLGRNMEIDYPGYEIRPAVDDWHHLLILHYLDLADGTPLSHQLMAFGDLPSGMVRGGGFDRQSEQDLCLRLGHRCRAAGAGAGHQSGGPAGQSKTETEAVKIKRYAMESTTMPVISAKNLNLWYGDFKALKHISLDVGEREITALIGPSGCGKSTFLKTLNRMNDLVPGVRIEGDVRLKGQDIFARDMELTDLRRRVGMVFQKANPFPMSIYDNITYGPKLHGVRNKAELDELVESSLRGAALWDEVKDRLKKSALGLSGGQQQRLCIARALAVEPEVLLMDEPTSALDPISTSKVEELATELKENYTIVMVTHNMQQAARISDKTAFFLLGELVEMGPTERVFATPVDKRTEDYISGRFG